MGLNVNRYVSGEKNQVKVTFGSGTTVNVGDLIFYDNADSLRLNGTSTKSNTGFPLEKLRAAGTSLEYNKTLVKSRLLGVALDDKDGGPSCPTKEISVATSGVFEFDMKPARTVKIGYKASPSGTSENSNMFNQKVMVTQFTNRAIGYFVENKTHALKAKVQIQTPWGFGTI